MTEDDHDLLCQGSFEIPGYNDLYEEKGINLDKAVAYLFGLSALATFNDRGKLVPGSVTQAKKLRESGSIRVNGEVYLNLRYTRTKEDSERGYVKIGVGKPSVMGGKGHEFPLVVMQEVTISRETYPEIFVMDGE